MASDKDLISKEDHELNYVLQKWEKRQTAENREILAKRLDDFKADDGFGPHNRESFYRYADEKDIRANLE